MPLLPKPPECQGCPIYGSGMGFIHPEGSTAIPLMLMGEGGGEKEEADGLPFRERAPAGSVLERVIKRAGFSRQQFVLWNAIGCRPPDNELEGASYETEAINHCRVHFNRVIERFRPKAILALGNVPLKTLTGMTGRMRTVTALRGYVLDSEYCPVIPTYHPSYLQRGSRERERETGGRTAAGVGKGGMHLLGVMIRDLRLAVQIAQGRDTGHILHPEFDNTLQFQERPSLDDARSFLYRVRDSSQAYLGYDIEHPAAQDDEEDD